MIECALLAVIPWIAMSVLYARSVPEYSSAEMMFHLLLLLCGGPVFFAFALLMASIFKGEYTSTLVSAAATIVLPLNWVFNAPGVRSFNPMLFLTGDDYVDLKTNLLSGPLPVGHLAGSLAAVVLMVIASQKIIEHRDFQPAIRIASDRSYPRMEMWLVVNGNCDMWGR